jgi:hypothetical protein
MSLARPLLSLLLGALLAWPVAACGADFLSAGPLYEQFYLTLDPGERTEIAGPLYYEEKSETRRTWAVPPLVSYTTDEAVELEEFDILYPILTYDRYGGQYRWQLLQLLSFSGGPTQTEDARRRFTIFPVYFQQRSTDDPSQDYTAVFPFYGRLKRRLFKEEIYFVMFPFYAQTKRARGVVTDNYVYPFFHLRHGPGLSGWQFWPLAGREHKEVTTLTNQFDVVRTIPGYDSEFILWPFYFNDRLGLGTDNPISRWAILPFYSQERSPKRDATSVLLFSYVDDRGKQYREWDFPWPLNVIARGEGKTTTRIFPIYSHAHSTNLISDFWFWPIYKYNRAQKPPLDRERTRICFYLYSDTRERNTETGKASRRTYLWPLYIYRQDLSGNERLQVLAPLEPFVQGSHKIPRDWSPIWSIWREEKNPATGAQSKSLLWNLYRREVSPTTKKVSCFFGLYQSHTTPEGRRRKLFYVPL